MHMYGVYHCLSPKLEAIAKAPTKGKPASSRRIGRIGFVHTMPVQHAIVVILYTTYFNYSLNRMTQDIISLAQSHDLYVSLACPLWRGVPPKPKDAWSSLWH